MNGFDDYPQLRPVVQDAVKLWLAEFADPAAMVTEVPWLSSELGALSSRRAASEPDQQWNTLVAIDSLFATPHPTRGLAPGGRLYFASITSARRRAPFSATGFLWSSGLSVIAVERPLIVIENETVEMALGVARWTPRQTRPQKSREPDRED